MCTICSKIFAKFEFFATISQMGVAYSAMKIAYSALSISDIFPTLPCLPSS